MNKINAGGMPQKTKGVILALLSSSIFGLIPFFSIPLINEGIGIPTILFYRFLFSSIIIGGICLIFVLLVMMLFYKERE